MAKTTPQPFHLLCVHPWAGYEKGQKVTEPSEIARLLNDREHHFVRVAIS